MNSHNSSRKTSTPVLKSTRLLDQLREQIRYLHYSLSTEEAYVYWVKNFIYFHGKRHPREMGQAQVEAFLTYLAVERKVSVSTHRQALSALLFLYQKVFGIELPWMDDLARPVPKRRIPVVMTRTEVQAVLGHLQGQNKVLASRCPMRWMPSTLRLGKPGPGIGYSPRLRFLRIPEVTLCAGTTPTTRRFSGHSSLRYKRRWS